MEIRVGLVCDRLDIGGQETGILELVRRLDRARFRPSVYTFRGGRLVPAFEALGVPVVVGSEKSSFGGPWTSEDDRQVREHVASLTGRLRADGIAVALVFAFARGVAAARAAGVPAIVERVDGPALASRIRDKSSCRRVICESESLRDLLLAQRSLLRLKPRRLVVIQNGIDLQRFDPDRHDRSAARAALGIAPDVLAVGTVARVAPEKNLGQLLAAAALFGQAHPADASRLHVVIAGPDGGDQARLEAEARRLGIADRVHFLGPEQDVPAVLSALDVYALTSIYEGVPFALLEAMAMGLPIITTPIAAAAELISGNGFVVGTWDAWQTCLSLGDLFRRPMLRASLGRRSRELAHRYDVARMARRYEETIEEALSEATSGPWPTRRVLFLDTGGSAKRDASAAAMADRFRQLRRAGVDAYLVHARPAAVEGDVPRGAPASGWPRWPPGRRYRVPVDTTGGPTVALQETLTWIDPDLVLAGDPGSLPLVRRHLAHARVESWSEGERLLRDP